MNLRQLEIRLEGLEGHPSPSLRLEQYPTPATVAARLLFHARMRGDIEGKKVCDLGCGTGTLACGAALLGASPVLGVDIDPVALGVAQENAVALGVEVNFLSGDITDPALCRQIGPCDTVVMNPPFGAQKRHADRPFIDRGLECAGVVWGIFNQGSTEFVRSFISGRAAIDEMISCRFPMRHLFPHHRRERVEIMVEILRIVKEGA